MGRQQYTQRKLRDPRDTFRFTTPNLDVTARPVDTFQQVQPDGELTSLAAALSTVNPALNSYVQAQESLTTVNAEKGKADRLRGKYDEPSSIFNIGKGYKEAWQHTDSQARVGLFSEELMTKVKDKNFFADAPNREEALGQFTKLKDELWAKHTAGAELDDTFMASAADLYHATTTKLFGAIIETHEQKKREQFLTNRLIVDKQSLKAFADNPNILPHQIIKEHDNDYELMIKDNPEINMTRDQWTMEKINAIGQAAMDILNDVSVDEKGVPRLSLSQKLTKVGRIMSVLRAKRLDGNGKEAPGYAEILSEDGKTPKFKAQIEAVENDVAQGIKQLQDAAEEQLKQGREMLMGYLQNKWVLDPNITLSQLNAELSKYVVGGGAPITLTDEQMEKLRNRKKDFLDKEEYINEDTKFIANAYYKIETNVGNWGALRDALFNARNQGIIRTDVMMTLMNRINTLENQEKSLSTAQRHAAAAERQAAADEKRNALSVMNGHYDAEEAALKGGATYAKRLMGINARRGEDIRAVLSSPTPYNTAKALAELRAKEAGASASDMLGPPNPSLKNVSDADLPKVIKNKEELILELDRREAAKELRNQRAREKKQGVAK